MQNAIVIKKADLKEHLEAIDAFCRWLLVEMGLKANTIYNYRKLVLRFLEHSETDHPSKRQAYDYVAMIRESNYSYAHVINTLRAVERYLYFLGTPVKIGRPKRPKPKIKSTLTEAEVAVIISAAKDVRERAILSLLAYSGARNEELCNLTVADVDLAKNLVHIRSGKGSKGRIVPIDGECTRILMQYMVEYPELDDSKPLFKTKYGDRPYTPWALRKLVKTVAARASIHKRVHPHIFRHSLATNMLHRGANPITIQNQLGHNFIETTMIYVHSNQTRLRAEYNVYSPCSLRS